LIADPARARATLGWTAERSDLATIIRDAARARLVVSDVLPSTNAHRAHP
jgi:UDP-glucose 4-epimerase